MIGGLADFLDKILSKGGASGRGLIFMAKVVFPGGRQGFCFSPGVQGN